MKLLFKNKKVEKLCLNESKAFKELSKDVALKLLKAIVALEEAINLNDILNLKFYNLHRLTGNREGEYSMYLGKTSGFRLIIVPLDKNEQRIKAHDMSLYIRAVCIEIEEVSNHYE